MFHSYLFIKTSQALREGQTEIRRQMLQQQMDESDPTQQSQSPPSSESSQTPVTQVEWEEVKQESPLSPGGSPSCTSTGNSGIEEEHVKLEKIAPKKYEAREGKRRGSDDDGYYFGYSMQVLDSLMKADAESSSDPNGATNDAAAREVDAATCQVAHDGAHATPYGDGQGEMPPLATTSSSSRGEKVPKLKRSTSQSGNGKGNATRRASPPRSASPVKMEVPGNSYSSSAAPVSRTDAVEVESHTVISQVRSRPSFY